jgi:cytochrome P450/NADPH-cytochrome P450 reductase
LDAASGHLSSSDPTVVVTASFEGQPAENAGRFVSDLTSTSDFDSSGSAFKGVEYAVFGCGSRDRAATYQRIPKLVDETLATHGATRLMARGEADASGADFFDSFDSWEAELWKVLTEVRIIPFSIFSVD